MIFRGQFLSQQVYEDYLLTGLQNIFRILGVLIFGEAAVLLPILIIHQRDQTGVDNSNGIPEILFFLQVQELWEVRTIWFGRVV